MRRALLLGRKKSRPLQFATVECPADQPTSVLKDPAMPDDEPPVELAQTTQRLDFNVLMRPGHRKRRVGGILMSASPIVPTRR